MYVWTFYKALYKLTIIENRLSSVRKFYAYLPEHYDIREQVVRGCEYRSVGGWSKWRLPERSFRYCQWDSAFAESPLGPCSNAAMKLQKYCIECASLIRVAFGSMVVGDASLVLYDRNRLELDTASGVWKRWTFGLSWRSVKILINTRFADMLPACKTLFVRCGTHTR